MDLTFPLAAVDDHGTWHIGIGDPTPIGWFTVFAYLAATAVSALVWRADLRARRGGRTATPHFWMVMTLLLLFLGINKQLDLQTLFGETGRSLAKQGGWYAQRRYFQVLFIIAVGVAGVIAIGVFSWMARNQWRRNLVALLGTVFLHGFVLIRASSIHHVDGMLQWLIMGWKLNAIIELGGISLTLMGAILALRGWPPLAAAGPGDRPDDNQGPRRYRFVQGVLVDHHTRVRGR